MVFYRKYRPQNIEELDSQEVREKLSSVLSKDSVHAMLFTGPKGLGKTSTARIVAKILNCEKLTEKDRKAGKLEPCDKCEQCISISNGSNIDVLEIDGASNRGIDEIRDLREKIKLSAARANKKVYIIDEVHMLTTEAFNALLKTLEEPPSHVVFILCTTEPHKVPATIASRCFQITFKKATAEELLRSFSRIAKAEKIEFDKEGLLEIAKFSDGSFRDGVKILEELAASAGKKKITKEFVENSYSTSGISKNVSEMIEALIKKDTKSGLGLVGKLTDEGIDLRYFMDILIGELHNILLEKAGVLKSSSKISEQVEIGDLKNIIEKMAEAAGKIKFSVLPQLPIEIAIIELSQTLSGTRQAHLKDDARDDSNTAGPAARHLVGAQSKYSASRNNSLRAAKAFDSRHPLEENNKDILQELIDKIKVNNQQIAGFLRGCLVKEEKNGELVLEAKFKFHKDHLDDPKAKMIIEEILKDMTGKSTKVSFVLK